MTKAGNLKSSEQIEMEQINKFHKELAKKRQLAKESMKLAQSSSGHMPVRAVHPVTEPKEFHFKTDQRLRAAGTKDQGGVTEVAFAATLRHNDQGATKKMATDVSSVIHRKSLFVIWSMVVTHIPQQRPYLITPGEGNISLPNLSILILH